MWAPLHWHNYHYNCILIKDKIIHCQFPVILSTSIDCIQNILIASQRQWLFAYNFGGLSMRLGILLCLHYHLEIHLDIKTIQSKYYFIPSLLLIKESIPISMAFRMTIVPEALNTWILLWSRIHLLLKQNWGGAGTLP